MKKHLINSLLFICLGCLYPITTQAQVPDGFIYQAEARDSHGTVIRNASLDVKITILAGSVDGIIVWEGTHEITTDKYGLFTLVIGKGTGSGYSFSAIDWAYNTHFLNVKVTDRRGNWVDMGTTQFLSVPYAMHAKTAANGFSGSYFDLWDAPTNLSSFFNDVGFLTIESDPIFTGHPAWGVTQANIMNWSSAFSWGDHSTAGYIKNFTETDPVFIGHAANGITLVNISDWIEAHNWGDHSQAGFLTGFAETDPIFAQHPASAIEIDDVTDWNSAFGWGDHASAGYLTSFSELDPLFMDHVAHTITSANLTNWMEAFSWGNHAEAGFLTSEVDADPANELQTLTLIGNTLTLSDGGSVLLPSGILTGGQYLYADKDADGYGYMFDPVYVPEGLEEPAGFILDHNDCDDDKESINPDAVEVKDEIDNDCDDEVDEFTNEPDADYDGDGYTINQGDCNDKDEDINPDAVEISDQVDNDCDGELDEYEGNPNADYDRDGFTIFQGDCNDQDADIYRQADEILDGKDNDCDNEVDEFDDIPYVDWDGDGYIGDDDCDDQDETIYPGAVEICDYVDNDCDGVEDENFDLRNDENNCGSCGNVCDLPNASAVCVQRICKISQCDDTYADRDGYDNNGCEFDLSEYPSDCINSEFLGQLCGDDQCGFLCPDASWSTVFTVTGLGSKWYRFYLKECSTCLADFRARISLEVPDGVDYDLFVYRDCVRQLGSSVSEGAATETVVITQDETNFDDDVYEIAVKVRFSSGTSSDPWTLKIEGTDCD